MSSSRAYSRERRELTPRMRDVLERAAAGLSVPATAADLAIAENTVRVVRAAICARLEVPNMAAAVHAAHRSGALR